MILVFDSENNLQTPINRVKSFFDFANIKLNPSKCEIFRINGSRNDIKIKINGVKKEYISKSFIKYHGAPMGSKKICKTKFIEAKIQKVLEELGKAEFCGLDINQLIPVIGCYILNKLYYVFAKMNLANCSLKVIEEKVMRVINRFVKGQPLPSSFIYASIRNGELGVPCMKDEYTAYKVHHLANLMSTTDGRGIMNGFLSMKKKVAKHLRLIDSLEEALNHLGIKWLDWDEFVEKRRKFEWTRNEKTNKT
jgi:hypothetical protein